MGHRWIDWSRWHIDQPGRETQCMWVQQRALMWVPVLEQKRGIVKVEWKD